VTDESISVSSVEEVISLLTNGYTDIAGTSQAIEHFKKNQYEFAYSKTLDLTDPAVEEEYNNRLIKKYMSNDRASVSNLYSENDAVGYLASCVIPKNLPSSKRNKASSWYPISLGSVVLCDGNWWSGEKRYLVGFVGFPSYVNLYSFDNKTNSNF